MWLFGSVVQISLLYTYLAIAKNVELSEEFEAYRECLEKVERDIGEEQRIKVVHAVRGADVILPCFTCVSPEDGVEIDSTYKPSAGSVGRTVNYVVDFFKQKFLRSSFSMPDKNRWKFDWQYAMMGRMFVPLSSMHFDASESISDRIRRFTSKDEAEFKIGDRYELVLKDVDANSTGHYRCINRHGRNVISNMYFLEVSNTKKIIPLNGSLGVETLPAEVTLKNSKFVKENLKVETKAGPWSKCSYCSSDRGEQTRTIKCYVEPSVRISALNPELRYLGLYDKIPCSSTLLPLDLRTKLKRIGNHQIFLETRPCFEECTGSEEISRIVNSSQDLGDIRTLDYLPGGEFVFGNILPRLLPPVVRRVRLVLENDPQVLSCQKLIDLNAGVHWYSMKFGPVQHTNIHELYKDRAYFDEETNLVFRKFALEDDDEYFCYSSNNILLGTFHMRVVENDQHHQIIEVVRIVVKFSAFIFILSLVASQLYR
ncbi:Ig-like domain-containing protein [Caenorhabditis elegans]|uniref:Ig-like domain-containing protein n=1 Tax=Caenorhabditis elegans TaxID=6239 RepID=Q86FM3_CAEEL|nr:Ig-like domain-containing protein [Caenorhabditis elegans]CCD74045.1 Ig-like domain-containing protein [Caenorhabditis elegans]|eukprot:NP_001023439.1 Uncharacterized protein CELE_Y37E11AR.7 [Caenorhabditis elegans]